MPINLRVRFDRPQPTYYAGETVTGHVLVHVDEPTPVRAIRIHIKGEARVQFVSNRHGLNLFRIKAKGHKKHLNVKSCLVGGDSGEVMLNPGENEYPFQCLLPHTLPSSFVGKHGYISYTATGVLQRPRGSGQKGAIGFCVVEPVDLNALPKSTEPIEMKNDKFFWCLWNKSGPLTMQLRAPRGGYTPGQTIPFQIQVDNASTYEVRKVRVTLQQFVSWYAECENTYSDEKLVDIDLVDSQVIGQDSKVFSHMITVPPTPPSYQNNKCELVKWKYYLRVCAVVGRGHFNLNISAPLLIGTTPVGYQDGQTGIPHSNDSVPRGSPWTSTDELLTK
ncbi:arrestin domain-containing protein 2-like [Frankliniella occidentalis]|uniref:Arrestin domain-containing protein 2-like n=1 Tax=Frankliniella occidentalis TaxID=133901 RepID=A0A6J1SPW2_FRAOC|nr:arrestin domain-containing protein 2-like [Frankliniella occidentalis]